MYSHLVDKTARRPSGWLGKMMYRNPRSHYRSFYLILDTLQLEADDIFLEIGCGGGVLLEMALKSVKKAKAIDHSQDMVQLAGERNQAALAEGRLEIVQGNAESLPWDDNTFTCAAASNMFFFIQNPMLVLQELHRVLRPGGRLAITSIEESVWVRVLFFFWSRSMKLYKNAKMKEMLQQAGFTTVQVKTEKSIQVSYAKK
jgi:ubiquinone/menaquinone biosynthesis C-methylase UbiE